MLQSHGLAGRRAEKLFDGREITSDGGAVLRREVDRASTEPRKRTSPFSMGPGSCGWPIPFGDARVEVGCPRKLAYHWIRTEHRPFRWWGPGAPPNIAHFILGGAGLGVSGRCTVARAEVDVGLPTP